MELILTVTKAQAQNLEAY
jgi:hypothetical protein